MRGQVGCLGYQEHFAKAPKQVRLKHVKGGTGRGEGGVGPSGPRDRVGAGGPALGGTGGRQGWGLGCQPWNLLCFFKIRLAPFCLFAKRTCVFSSYWVEGGFLSFNHKATHKYYIIILLLDKNGFYLEAYRVTSRAVALLKSWPAHLSLFSCCSGLFLSGVSFKGMLSLFFPKAHAQTEQQAGVADSSREGTGEGVDVSRLAASIKYAGAGAPLTATSQTRRSPEGWQETSSPTETPFELE